MAKQLQKFLTCGQLRNTQRCQKYVRLVIAFFLEFCTSSSQQCTLDKDFDKILQKFAKTETHPKMGDDITSYCGIGLNDAIVKAMMAKCINSGLSCPLVAACVMRPRKMEVKEYFLGL